MASSKFSVQIPFPAWDGINMVNALISELRGVEGLEQLYFIRPRNIELKETSVPVGFESGVRLKLWVQGTYATAVLGGTKGQFNGTYWSLVNLKLSWGQPKRTVELSASEIEALQSPTFMRKHKFDDASIEEADRSAASVKQRLTDTISVAA